MAVADGHSDDPSKHIEVPPSLVVPQPLHAALVDEQGGPVVGGLKSQLWWFEDFFD